MAKIEFESLKTRRATDMIESHITNLIVKGKIAAGEKLPTEKELSDQFDVSIVTIREALRGMEVAGFIEKKRGKGGGIYVREINSDALIKSLHTFLRRREFTAEHLTQVRLTIEPTIIRTAAQLVTGDELASLEDNLKFCDSKIEEANGAISLKDYDAIGEKNRDFHRLLAQATQNPVFALTMDYLLDFIFDFKKSLFTPDINLCSQVVNDHKGIYTALKNGKTDQAEEKMLSHLKYLELYEMNNME